MRSVDRGRAGRHACAAAGCVAVGLLLALWAPTAAQQRPQQSEQRVARPGETQFNLQLLRPSGGPVIPIFEGWYQHPDGRYELSFGYFNVNTEEVIEIPQGPDNFIEPRRYDGGAADPVSADAGGRPPPLGRVHGDGAGRLSASRTWSGRCASTVGRSPCPAA